MHLHSQLEPVEGRIPPISAEHGLSTLGIDARDFVLALLPFYDPTTHIAYYFRKIRHAGQLSDERTASPFSNFKAATRS